MSTERFSGIPDWQAQINGLTEALEDVLELVAEDRRAGVRPDITCLAALDNLNRYLELIKQDMGV